jgi:Divalent cation transporter
MLYCVTTRFPKKLTEYPPHTIKTTVLILPAVIRGLAIGNIDDSNAGKFLWREFAMGIALSLILGIAGCIRAAIFMTPFLETVAITASLFIIVIISIILGAMMPLGMKKMGIDPAHSSTTIQVVMDILGVSITVWVSSLVLDTGFWTGLTPFSTGGRIDATHHPGDYGAG